MTPVAEPISAQPVRPRRCLRKALIVSALLHLALALLIQPARWTLHRDMVIEARLSPAPTRPVEASAAASPVASPEPPAPAAAATQSKEPLPPASIPQVSPPVTGVVPRTDGEPHREAGVTPAVGRDDPSALPLPEVPLLIDTRWYTAREVERRPEPIGEILPAYPEEARRRGIEGSVVVALHIDETGAVREVEVLESSPPGVFDAAVVAAYSQARFRPAALAGRPVRYVGKYRVVFELE